MKCLGGTIQGKLWPKDDAERQRALDAGHDLDRVLSTDDLVSGDNVFFVATGITDGELLRGVRYRAETATTESIVMRSKSGTIRQIDSDAPAVEAARLQRDRLRPRQVARAGTQASVAAAVGRARRGAPRLAGRPTSRRCATGASVRRAPLP